MKKNIFPHYSKSVNIKHFFLTFLITYILLQAGFASAEIRLPHLINDGMVLQREAEVSIWGWAEPHEEIFVEFRGNKQQAVTTSEGKWSIPLKPMKAGGPYAMEIYNQNDRISIKDIWIGDVWLCSGQSNMETTMERVSPMFPEEFVNIPNLPIRYFDVPDDYSFTEVKKDLRGGKWAALNEDNIMSFAAVAYFFSKKIHSDLNVPIGIINASVGGSPIESWLSEEDLQQFPEDYAAARFFQAPGVIDSIERVDQKKIRAWQDELTSKDKGLHDPNNPWHASDIEMENWSKMESVDLWPTNNGRPENGVFWFKKEINIDESQIKNTEAKLLLGTLIDSDHTYVNGQLVGSTGYRYPPRRYTIPEGILTPGRNVIVVRIVSERGRGGFVTEKPYQLQLAGDTLDLSTGWYYKQGAAMPAAPSQTAIRFKPMGLYNAMIAPLEDYNIKGILWYQGESNTGNTAKYEDQFKTLINARRASWNNPDLPFLYVQLPNFMSVSDDPQESEWAAFREVQRKALKIPHTGMAITIDVGEANDIHPLDKKSVGERLALQAMKVAYGKSKGVFSGPLVQQAKNRNGKITLEFKEVGERLKVKSDTPLSGFALAGADGKFVWAEARIIGKNKVEVWHPNIASPKVVRYAYADNPSSANLYNSKGLPASPFELSLE